MTGAGTAPVRRLAVARITGRIGLIGDDYGITAATAIEVSAPEAAEVEQCGAALEAAGRIAVWAAAAALRIAGETGWAAEVETFTLTDHDGAQHARLRCAALAKCFEAGHVAGEVARQIDVTLRYAAATFAVMQDGTDADRAQELATAAGAWMVAAQDVAFPAAEVRHG